MWLLSLGVQLSVVFRVPGIDIHEAEEVKAQFLSPVLPGGGHCASKAIWPEERVCHLVPEQQEAQPLGSRLGHQWHLPEVRAVPSTRSLGVCPWSRASVSSLEKWDTMFA